jgi:pimeloyl-ACP methyl ester carboxylesterase
MAIEFVRWMDRWVRDEPDRPLPDVNETVLEVLPDDMLACNPRQDRNIFSINRDMASALEKNRSGLPIDAAVRLLAHVEGPASTPVVRSGERSLCWFHHVQELMIEPEQGIELPATYVVPSSPAWRGGAVLYFDDRGRWTDLRQQGLLASITGALDENTNGPAILTVDLRGWGDTRPADTNYDIAGWAHRERWTAYVSAALGDHVLAMRIRDGLAALTFLRSRPEIDAARIVVGGHGMGGIVALHVAAADQSLAGTFAIDGLATFDSLAASNRYTWSPEAFLPGVLNHYDVPELVQKLDVPCLIANPLGAAKEPLPREQAKELYADAWGHGGPPAVSQFVQNCLTAAE